MSHNRFRPLNDNEIHMLLRQTWNKNTSLKDWLSHPFRSGLKYMDTENYKLAEDTPFDALEVSYETIFSDHRTNPTPEFVICLIRCYISEYPIAFVWRGVSRCARGDKFNRQRGEALAFLRAIRHSKPVEI